MQQILIYIVAAATGAAITFYLQKFGISSVLASCLVGIGGVALGSILKTPELAAVVFTGTFVGMTENDWATLTRITLAGGVSGLLFGMTVNIFEGLGGKLGTIAFLSLVFVIVVFSILGGKVGSLKPRT